MIIFKYHHLVTNVITIVNRLEIDKLYGVINYNTIYMSAYLMF